MPQPVQAGQVQSQKEFCDSASDGLRHHSLSGEVDTGLRERAPIEKGEPTVALRQHAVEPIFME